MFLAEHEDDLTSEMAPRQEKARVRRASAATRATTGASVCFSRDEMNLAEFPLAVLSTRTDPSVKTLEFRDVQRLRTGETVERQWVITGADKFGLPTSTDDDVILGLIRLTMQNGFEDRKVYFTRYELLKILRWTTEGRSYQRLTKSLDRLSGVRIKSQNAFYDNASKSYQTCNFGIIDAYEIISERRDGSGDLRSSYFVWSELLFDSFRSGFIKKLDLDLYFSLKSSVSRRLYRFLDKHFYYRNTVERPLMPLAFEKLGLSRSYRYPSSVKQQLEPALSELVEVGYLGRYEYLGQGTETLLRMCRGNLGVSTAVEAVAEPNKIPASVQTTDSRTQEFIQQLTKRGISIRQAQRLLDGKSPQELERIPAILGYYDSLVATQDRRVSKNAIGFLYRAVEKPLQFTVPERVTKQPPAARRPYREQILREVSERSEAGTRQAYQRYREQALEDASAQIGADEIARISAELERKMAPLRRSVSQERFRKAVEDCTTERIAQLAGIPEYRAWLVKEGSQDTSNTHAIHDRHAVVTEFSRRG